MLLNESITAVGTQGGSRALLLQASWTELFSKIARTENHQKVTATELLIFMLIQINYCHWHFKVEAKYGMMHSALPPAK